jgi:tripartite-type tricarboxylate transporter receptor subunit TctC
LKKADLKKALLATAALLFCFCTGALGQAYPAKPVRVIVPFPAGGVTDILARLLGQRLNEFWGQPVIVENRAGAGGNIAVDYVAKSAPDGYTLVLANVGAIAVNPHMIKVPYDPRRDLTPIVMASVFANVLVVQPGLPVKSIADYVKLAREKPATITYASSGVGGAGHLAGELLHLVARIDIVHVPYKGGGPAMQGFLGGQVDSFFATPTSSIGQVNAGKARAIATTGSKRAALLPDIPTVAESGYPGYEALNWYAYFGPKGMPKDIVERLNRELRKALNDAETTALLHKQGVEPQPGTPEELARYVEREYQTWGRVVKEAGIKAQ